MKILDTVRNVAKRAVDFVVEQKDKALVALGLGMVGGATESKADVTYTEATGFVGSFDLAPYYSAIGMVIGAIAVVASIKLAVSAFRRVG